MGVVPQSITRRREATAVPLTLTPCPLPAASFRAAETLALLGTALRAILLMIEILHDLVLTLYAKGIGILVISMKNIVNIYIYMYEMMQDFYHQP